MVIVVKLLEIIASPRANKIAGRLKIYDKDKFFIVNQSPNPIRSI